MPDQPFDASLPSPLGRLARLRASAAESVVRDGETSALQRLMAPPGALESALWGALERPDAPSLLVLTGSAGTGKSAIINHLIERDGSTDGGRIGAHLADATHADSPNEEQAGRLTEFFAPFRDGAPVPPGPCRIIAMNTGMVLSFFHQLRELADAPPLEGLESLLRARLRIPGPRGPVPPWMEASVLVVNLDHRSTAGTDSDLLDELLQRLDPQRLDGVFEGSPRCSTCTVQNWCWPMANVTVLSSAAGRRAIGRAAGDVALSRGRHLAPRALWDLAASLALSGLRTADGADPCLAIAGIAASESRDMLVQGLACNAALEAAEDASTLLGEVALRDPGFHPSSRAHRILSEAGLDPEADAEMLTTWMTGDGLAPHPASSHAAAILRAGLLPPVGEMQYWGRVLARAAWLAGEIRSETELPAVFRDAIAAQSRGQTAIDRTPEGQAVEHALEAIEAGVAATFGFSNGSEYFYPTAARSGGAAAELLVRADLINDEYLVKVKDPILSANERGAHIVGYRPLALHVELAGHLVPVDYPLWHLLELAASGAVTSSGDLERFLSLRQAIRFVGAEASKDPGKPLLLRVLGPGGRRFRVAARGRDILNLRVTEDA